MSVSQWYTLIYSNLIYSKFDILEIWYTQHIDILECDILGGDILKIWYSHGLIYSRFDIVVVWYSQNLIYSALWYTLVWYTQVWYTLGWYTQELIYSLINTT